MNPDRKFWDRLAVNYSKSQISDAAGYQRTLERTTNFLKSSDAVLELGCGTGSTAFLLAPKVKSFLGTDISPEMIRIAQEKQQQDNDGAKVGLSFLEGTADTIAEQNPTAFNAILGYNYLHLVRDTPATLQKIHSMLRNDGLFISKTPCLGDRNFVMKSLILPTMTVLGFAPYLSTFRSGDLVSMIQTAGFEIVAKESHSSGSDDGRAFIVARKMNNEDKAP